MRAQKSTGRTVSRSAFLTLAALAALVCLREPDARAAAASSAQLPYCQDAAPSADEPYLDFARRARRDECRKPWTILVYMAADNDLAPYALWDLHEMEAGYKSGRRAAGSTARADLLVQVAMPGQVRARRLHVFQSDETYDSRLRIADFKGRSLDQVRSPVVSLEERTSAAAADFERFVEWGMREYPSDHVMVVVWGHGQGWAPEGAASAPSDSRRERRFGGLAFSDSNGAYLDTPGLRRALATARAGAGLGRKIDVYASDACLMQMVEVAYEISDQARFIVGSAQMQNYLGLPYRRFLFELNTGRFAGLGSPTSEDEPHLVARMLPILFRSSLRPQGLHGRELPEAWRTATISSISSDELQAQLVPALRELARALSEYLAQDPIRAIGVAQAIKLTPGFMGGSLELSAFLRLLERSMRMETEGTSAPAFRRLRIAIATATDAIDRSVAQYAIGSLYTGDEPWLHLLGFRGLAMWLPVSKRELESRLGDFASSRLYLELAGDWQRWLRQVYDPYPVP